ncbi:hypothetical protein ATANTOWER_026604 [Ataeniobius toweri]|uniref:Uncharacterized protein n=1 Tax=Ataeniobius toweri TaxID=208326 RepID=A0ABU7B0Y2_9TELE|nr:hypothetical protein [Ataeniobius toweri]
MAAATGTADLTATAMGSSINNRRGEQCPLGLYLQHRAPLRAPPDAPSRPSLYVWTCQVCLAFSSSSGSNSPPGGDQWTAQTLSSPECPKHAAEGLTTRHQNKLPSDPINWSEAN